MKPPRHRYKLTKTNLEEVEQLLPRLKYSVAPSKVIRWLENFEEDEVKQAQDMLAFIEYIDGPEMQFRFNDLFQDIVNEVPSTSKIIVYPFGDADKSGEHMRYYLNKTESFTKRKKANEDLLVITKNLERESNPPGTVLVLLDDFVGSGDSFHKAYINEVAAWVDQYKDTRVYLLSLIIMKRAAKYLSILYPNLKIKATERGKCFGKVSTPFRFECAAADVKKTVFKYTKGLKGKDNDKESDIPFGYKNTQALIAFSHGTPNNTIPLIWMNYRSWYPLYPRESVVRMRQARDLKREIAYYMGIDKRLGIDRQFVKQERFKFIDEAGLNRTFEPKKFHGMLTVMKLKMEMKLENPVICQVLGITMHEFGEVIASGVENGYLDKQGNVTELGAKYFKALMQAVKKEQRKKPKIDLENIKKINYVPRTFGGRE